MGWARKYLSCWRTLVSCRDPTKQQTRVLFRLVFWFGGYSHPFYLPQQTHAKTFSQGTDCATTWIGKSTSETTLPIYNSSTLSGRWGIRPMSSPSSRWTSVQPGPNKLLNVAHGYGRIRHWRPLAMYSAHLECWQTFNDRETKWCGVPVKPSGVP